MFADAYEIATKFTMPVALLERDYHGKCTSGLGAFVPVNEDGWVLTAGHILQRCVELKEARQRFDDYENKKGAIDQSATKKQRQKARRSLGKTDGLIRNWSQAWGFQDLSVRIAEGMIDPHADLGVARLNNWDPKWVEAYPAFKTSDADMRRGQSLLRIGFPFHTINVKFDTDQEKFILPDDALPIPYFPSEGIYTRAMVIGDSPDNGYPCMMLETSSPGLRGQSGGPIVDTDGVVWAIQSRTTSHSLGFNPSIKVQGRSRTEHQFLNVGLGAHAETIAGFLRKHGVDFQEAD